MIGTYEAIGDIDMATAPAFVADLRRTIDDADETIVGVDCSSVTFMDSAGYHALVGASEYAARGGHTLTIYNASTSCARLIRLCDVDGTLSVSSPTDLVGNR